jgi:long-chain fatty acid transport protein
MYWTQLKEPSMTSDSTRRHDVFFFLPILVLSLAIATPARGTDGYFVPGYGVTAQGQGGAGVASPQDSLAGATNPAGLAWVGNRFDLGATAFRPIRFGEISGNQLPPGYPDVNGEYDANGKKIFVIPELGYSRSLSPRIALGLAIFGNGGLNTSYITPIRCSAARTRVSTSSSCS